MPLGTAATPFRATFGRPTFAGAFDPKPTAVYFCPGLDRDVAEALKVTRSKSIRTLTGSRAYVKAGIAIGIINVQDKPKLLVNLPASRAEGAKLDSAILRVAEVIR